ncbi:hypothetical protein Vpro01_03497 [Vibrio proteolyticus]
MCALCCLFGLFLCKLTIKPSFYKILNELTLAPKCIKERGPEVFYLSDNTKSLLANNDTQLSFNRRSMCYGAFSRLGHYVISVYYGDIREMFG